VDGGLAGPLGGEQACCRDYQLHGQDR
jgi:hypothetical protein